MSIGADRLLQEYSGSRLAVAEALLMGKLNPNQEDFADELIDWAIMEAAKFRVKEGLTKKKSELPKKKK